jgi:hypothetical protein
LEVAAVFWPWMGGSSQNVLLRRTAERVARVVGRGDDAVAEVHRHALDLRLGRAVAPLEVEVVVLGQAVVGAHAGALGLLRGDEVHVLRPVAGVVRHAERVAHDGHVGRGRERRGAGVVRDDRVRAGAARQVAGGRLDDAGAGREAARAEGQRRAGEAGRAAERHPVVGRGERPVHRREGVAVLGRGGELQLELPLRHAVGERRRPHGGVGGERVLVAQRQLAAGVVAAEDDVDDAADRVGAVDGRGAAEEHLDALDGGDGDAGEVGGVVAADETGARDTAAVDHDQRVLAAEAAEVEGAARRRGRAGDRAVRGGGRALLLSAEADAVERALRVGLRDEARDLADGGDAGALDLHPAEGHDRVDVGRADEGADARAGDLELLEADGPVVGLPGRRRRRPCVSGTAGDVFFVRGQPVDGERAALLVLHHDQVRAGDHAVQRLAGGEVADDLLGRDPAHVVDEVDDLLAGLLGELLQGRGRLAGRHPVGLPGRFGGGGDERGDGEDERREHAAEDGGLRGVHRCGRGPV